MVSQRTRSKLPLTETPLECLEMAFRPPDVTTDMYETEVDNEEWKEFLIDFIHPLSMILPIICSLWFIFFPGYSYVSSILSQIQFQFLDEMFIGVSSVA